MAGSAACAVNPIAIYRFATDHELAAAAAKRWVIRLGRLGAETPCHVALSGGRITEKFFESIVEQCKRSDCSLDHLHFFWADERCVPPSDAASNFRIAKQLLFEPLEIRPSQTHRIQGEIAKELAVERAISEVRDVVPLNGEKQPVFDMVFLGMGEDGHVASLFPNEPADVVSNPAIYRSVSAAKPPPIRVTLGYAAIATAKEVWVLASGTGKEEAFHKSLETNSLTSLGRVLRMREKTILFTDIPDTRR